MLFFAILIIGFSIRIYNLSNIPAGFFADEASVGYNAYTILTKGTDQYGVSFPIFFKAFGEYKNPVQIYSSVPIIAILGLNELSTRLTSVIYGLLAIVAISLLSKELFGKQKKHLIALLSALFLAISPWAIHFSRVSLEGLMPFVFFTTLGLYLFLKALKIPKLLPFSIISFTLGLYSYFPARIFIPLFGIGLLLIYFRFFIQHKKETIITGVLLLFLLLPFILNFFSSADFARWEQVNIFSNPPKNETVLQHIAANYWGNFSADFLFLKGDSGMPGEFITRHSVQGMGELYLFQLPLIIFGLFYLLKRNKKFFLVILLWLILYPTGSMFTADGPQATRTIIGVVPFQILAAAGAVYLLNFISKQKKLIYSAIVLTSIIVIIISVINYLSLYFIYYPSYSSDFWGWQYGAKEIVNYFSLHQSDYDNLIMAPQFNSPKYFLAFIPPMTAVNA